MEPYILEKDGKQYMYRSTSHYSKEKGGPVADTEYMGRVKDGKLIPKKGYRYDEKTGEFGPIDDAGKSSKGGNVAVTTKRYGDGYLLQALQRRLHLLDDLIESFGEKEGKLIMAVAMAYTIRPGPLMYMDDLLTKSYIPELLGMDDDLDFSSQRMSELTNHIGSSVNSMEEFFSLRINGANGEYLFDLTSESTYSAVNTMAEWGRNKDHVPLTQVNLGLVTDKVGKPLMFHLYPGSMADVATLHRMVADIKRLGGKDATLISDRGFISAGSIMYMLDQKMDFIAPMIIGDNPVMKSLVTEVLASIGDVSKMGVYDGRSYTIIKKQIGVRRMRGANKSTRETLWEDPDGYDLLLDTDVEYGSCDGYIDAFVFRDVAAAGLETAGMDIILNEMIGKMKGHKPRDPQKYFNKVAGKYANLLEWKMGEEGMEVSIRQNAHTFASNRKGIFVMITPSSKNRGYMDVLTSYDCRDKIEDEFLQDKSEGDGRTPRSGDRETIAGRTFIRMVSGIMRMEMINTVNAFENDPKVRKELKPKNLTKRGPTSLLGSLSNIDIVCGGGWAQLTELTRDNRLIYNMFNVGPPKGIDRP